MGDRDAKGRAIGAACAGVYAAHAVAEARVLDAARSSAQVVTVQIPARLEKVIPPPKPWELERGAHGHFAPGACPNPGGRPKHAGAAALIAQLTGGGAELIAHGLLLMRGELAVEQRTVDQFGQEHVASVSPTISEQQRAREWLADRLWGRAPETVKIEASTSGGGARGVDPSTLSPDELAAVLAISVRALPDSTPRRDSEPATVEGVVLDGVPGPPRRSGAADAAGVREGAPPEEDPGAEPR